MPPLPGRFEFGINVDWPLKITEFPWVTVNIQVKPVDAFPGKVSRMGCPTATEILFSLSSKAVNLCRNKNPNNVKCIDQSIDEYFFSRDNLIVIFFLALKSGIITSIH